MGTVRDAVRRSYIAKHGRRGWQQHLRTIEGFWRRLADELRDRPLEPARTRLYQDGLPVCGIEQAIVRELAAAGSRNHLLLRSLLERGCELVGTEDPDLLRAERDHLKQAVMEDAGSTSPDAAARRDRSRALLERRDRFIAGRIDETLGPGDLGILFIGALHDVGRYLPGDIRVATLSSAPDGPAAVERGQQ